MLRRIFGGVNLSKTVSQINSLLDDLDKTKALLITTDEEDSEVKDVDETPKNSTDSSSDDTKTEESKVRLVVVVVVDVCCLEPNTHTHRKTRSKKRIKRR